MSQFFLKRISSAIKVSILNGILITILIILNIENQAFCIPTTWTIIILTICFLNTILYPILYKTKLAPGSAIINGISFFVYSYCILFLEQVNVYGLLFSIILIGSVVFIPHFFVLQLLWKNIIHPPSKSIRLYFLIPFPICIAIVFFVGHLYSNAMLSVKKFEESNYEKLEKNFMTEKILGMHFIYHTRYCEFDGWRPPKHEPILVIGMWLNGRQDPLHVSLEKRLELYKKFFPEKPYKFDCSCGIEHSEDYHHDKLWKQ